MVVYDNLYGLITQGCQYSINLASGSQNVTLRTIVYLIDKGTRKKKEKKFLLRSGITSGILKSDVVICASETCGVDKSVIPISTEGAIVCHKIYGTCSGRAFKAELLEYTKKKIEDNH